MNIGKPQLSGTTAPAPEIPAGAKVLVLGSTGHANVRAVPWEAELPNIVDFHVCVVVVKTLSDDFLRTKPHEYFDTIADQLRRLLLSKGKVIVLGENFRRIPKPKRYPDNITNYRWCPFLVSFQSEGGDTVERKTPRFSRYLSALKRWSFHYECSEIREEWIRSLGNHERWEISTLPLATNREGRLLAGCHKLEIYRGRLQSGAVDPYIEWPKVPSFVAGEFVFLSPLQDNDERETVALLLSDLGLKEETPPPQWVDKVDVPGVAELTDKIAHIVGEIRTLEGTKSNLDLELQKLKRWSRLLYATGQELEEIFRESLIALGGQVEAAKYASEEYILRTHGNDILVEVKGNTKSISLDNVRQLLDYTLHYLRDTGKEGKGVLFGNAWRLIPPEERDTKGKPYFPDEIKRTAAKHGIALLSSKDYLAVFCKFLKGEVKGQYILEKLVKANGVVVF